MLVKSALASPLFFECTDTPLASDGSAAKHRIMKSGWSAMRFFLVFRFFRRPRLHAIFVRGERDYTVAYQRGAKPCDDAALCFLFQQLA